LWGGLLTAPQPFNHVSTSFGTITIPAQGKIMLLFP
jgi:hypothetical protein